MISDSYSLCIVAEVPADSEHHLRGAQLHHHLPHAHQHPGPLHEEAGIGGVVNIVFHINII